MSYQYSCFISYRRHVGVTDFVRKFKEIVETEAFKVTNQKKAFFDEEEINWGAEFDVKIYQAINSSCFFIPMFNFVYLHEDNLWCAKELHWAIQLENKIRETVENYCFILPVIDKGTPSDFPNCIGRKNAKEINQFRHLILNKTTSKAFEDFKIGIYNTLLQNYKLLNNNSFCHLLDEISPISDEDLKLWIKDQKNKEKENASKHIPLLIKNSY